MKIRFSKCKTFKHEDGDLQVIDIRIDDENGGQAIGRMEREPNCGNKNWRVFNVAPYYVGNLEETMEKVREEYDLYAESDRGSVCHPCDGTGLVDGISGKSVCHPCDGTGIVEH